MEQILLAFLWIHFNHEKDLKNFYQALPFEYFTHEPFLPFQEVVDDTLSMALINGLTPYGKQITALASYGNCYPYHRVKDHIIETTDFADCVETKLRHLCTLFLYDTKTQRYKTEHLSFDVKGFFDNLISPNDGSIETRSQWNRLVGDLNAKRTDLPKVSYLKKNAAEGYEYELNSGFCNMANVLIRVFDIYDKHILSLFYELNDQSKTPDQFTTPLQNSLKVRIERLFWEIFTLIHNNANTEIKLNFCQEGPDFYYYEDPKPSFDIYGELIVEFGPKNLRHLRDILEKKVALTLFSHPDHAEIKNSYDMSIQSNPSCVCVDRFHELPHTLQLVAHFNSSPHLSFGPLLYQLMGRKLSDHEDYINYLKVLAEADTINPLIPVSCGHVLDAINWHDDPIYKQCCASINPLYAKHPSLRSVLSNHVKRVLITNDHEMTSALTFTKIHTLKLDGKFTTPIVLNDFESLENVEVFGKLSSLTLGDHTALKRLIICGEIDELDLRKATALQELIIDCHSKIHSLKLGANNINLKRIKIGGEIESAVDLSELSSLETLEIRQKAKLDCLKLSVQSLHLKELLFLGTIKNPIDLGFVSSLPLLETMAILCGTKLSAFTLSKNNTALKQLTIYAKLDELDLSNAPSLEDVVIIKGSKIRSLTMSANHKKLKRIEIYGEISECDLSERRKLAKNLYVL